MRKNPHVRIRGGLGSVTALVYPTVCARFEHELLGRGMVVVIRVEASDLASR